MYILYEYHAYFCVHFFFKFSCFVRILYRQECSYRHICASFVANTSGFDCYPLDVLLLWATVFRNRFTVDYRILRWGRGGWSLMGTKRQRWTDRRRTFGWISFGAKDYHWGLRPQAYGFCTAEPCYEKVYLRFFRRNFILAPQFKKPISSAVELFRGCCVLCTAPWIHLPFLCRLSRHCFVFLSHTDDDDRWRHRKLLLLLQMWVCDLQTTRHIRVKSVEFCGESRDYFLTSILAGLIMRRVVAVRSLLCLCPVFRTTCICDAWKESMILSL